MSFDDLLQAVHPLGDPERMGNGDFKVSVTIVFGDEDYMRVIDGNDSMKLLNKLSNKQNNYYILNESGHVLNKDNTVGLTTIIISDTLGSKALELYIKEINDAAEEEDDSNNGDSEPQGNSELTTL